MFHSNALKDELQALQRDAARLPKTSGEAALGASSRDADQLADQVREALDDLGETLRGEEDHAEQRIAERPITALAAAFALGVVAGFMLRRRQG